MKRIISICLVIFLLVGILTACGDNDSSSIPSSPDQTIEEISIPKKDLKLDTITKKVVGSDTESVYSYVYYDNYIECTLASNVYNIIYYDKDLKTAYIGSYGKSIDDIKKGEWFLSVTYDENNKIVSFGSQGGLHLFMQHIVEYKNENQIVLNNESVFKSPNGNVTEELGADIIEYKEDKIILYSEDSKNTLSEYNSSDNKMVSYTHMILGEKNEFTLEYDKTGAIYKETKKSPRIEQSSYFSYAVNKDFEIWHTLAPVSNFSTATDMMVYLLTTQRDQ